ncbi:putative defense protein 3 [Neocloeon triangulifer]|uniref:putative defense protein 3 n=1 Tax=Neocloeon triangulifer TaxID=2078957 RepID=UPI00286F5188|nr:putative defense protein 3 [Neocloeon triangulifer]
MKVYIGLLICSFLHVEGVLALTPTGAPPEACRDMAPQHGAAPQPEPSPYSAEVVEIEPKKYTLTIYGDPVNILEGFMIQARDRSSGLIKGTFEPVENEIKVIDCLGGVQNCATHADESHDRWNVTVTWNAPDGNLDNINFVYTALKALTEYWINQIEPLIPPSA